MRISRTMRKKEVASGDFPETDGVRDARFVTALARGIEVLRAFDEGRTLLGNSDITELTGIPGPTVSRLTYTLSVLGCLSYLETEGKYRLGLGTLSLGHAALSSIELRDVARPYMRALADAANASVHLGYPDELEMVYVEACRAPRAVVLRMGVGSRLPMAQSAVGRAYLAGLAEDEREVLLGRLSAACSAAERTRLNEPIKHAAEEVTRQGFMVSLGDWHPEINAAATPARTPDGRIVGAFNIGGLASLFTRDRLIHDLGPQLATLARQVALRSEG